LSDERVDKEEPETLHHVWLRGTAPTFCA
jgi:hypothetical protein